MFERFRWPRIAARDSRRGEFDFEHSRMALRTVENRTSSCREIWWACEKRVHYPAARVSFDKCYHAWSWHRKPKGKPITGVKRIRKPHSLNGSSFLFFLCQQEVFIHVSYHKAWLVSNVLNKFTGYRMRRYQLRRTAYLDAHKPSEFVQLPVAKKARKVSNVR